ncbi:alanine-zipper protein, partial [Nostoc sp.]|uniref:alanine-zipper protein n=1 Tax=Nostoc sp. TaxID=1180 RepID=UPI002FF49227
MADSCAELSSEIAALRAEIARIPRVDEAAIINTAKLQAKDLILPIVFSYVLAQLKPVQELIFKLEGSLAGLSGKITNILGKLSALELSIANALKTAASALGISNQALKEIGELFAKIAPLLNLIGTVANILETIATLETLGSRIDAVERGLQALGASVSDILGKLLGLQNRISRNEATIGEVRGIAENAKGIGEGAARLAGDAQAAAGRAQGTANSALAKAGQAQSTADAANRNASQANENAKSAYQKAVEAQLTANQATTKANEATTTANRATNKAGEAFSKAVEALGVALTAIALYQGLKSLRGLQGIPGINGRNGVDGRNGIDGAPGVTTVVQIPGEPGAQGAPGRPGTNGFSGLPGRNGTNGSPGINGVNGRNGIDVNPADLAGLRALIITQHAATRTNINATSSGLVNGVKAFFTTQLAGITTLITAIATNTYVEKAMSLMTLAVTIHNGFMLSSSLGQTLGTIVDQCVALVVPKGIDGQPISITHVLGGAVMDIVKNVVGTENYTTITTDLAKANRIYQAGVNVFNQVGNAVGILTSGLELIAGNTGKIGNA